MAAKSPQVPVNLDWTQPDPSRDLTPFQQFVHSVDWASTSLGPMKSWDVQLRSMALMAVGNSAPSIIYWGSDKEDLVALYNEAYTELIGQKHPSLMGQNPRVGLAELWDHFDGIIEHGCTTGLATSGGNALPLIRHGFLEEAFFEWSFMPVVGPNGWVVGTYATVTENTQETLADRRMKMLNALNKVVTTAKTLSQHWTKAVEGLAANPLELPLVLFYSLEASTGDDEGDPSLRQPFQAHTCRLVGASGVPSGHISAPEVIDFVKGSEGFVSAFKYSLGSATSSVMLRTADGSLPISFMEGIRCGDNEEPVSTVIVRPIQPGSSKRAEALGFCVLGLNPRRHFDNLYESFVNMVFDVISTPKASAVLLAQEKQRSQSAAIQATYDQNTLSEKLLAITQEFEQVETRLSRFGDVALDGLVIANADGTIAWANEAWYSLHDGAKDIDGAYIWLDSIHDDDIPAMHQLWDDLTVRKTPTSTRYRLKKPWKSPPDDDGVSTETPRWVISSAVPDFNPDGTIKCITACVTDISRQKWQEAQILMRTVEAERTEMKWKRFADHAPIGIAIQDAEGRMSFANEAFHKITGHPKDTVGTPMSWRSIFHEEDYERLDGLFAQLVNGQESVEADARLKKLWKAPVASQTDEPHHAWILSHVFVEKIPELQIISCITDISETKYIQEIHLKRMQDALELKRRQENFIDMTSHEMRNPLSAILQCADQIITSLSRAQRTLYLEENKSSKRTTKSDLSDRTIKENSIKKRKPSGDGITDEQHIEDSLQAAQTIVDCAQHQKRIVDDILVLSRLESDLLLITPVVVEAVDVVRGALKMFEGELKATSIVLNVDIQSSITELKVDWMLLDPSRVLQVFINLLTNAIKFTKRRAALHNCHYVRVQEQAYNSSPEWGDGEALYLHFAIKDTGRGLSVEEKKVLFMRFSQASPRTHVEYGGSGLGLFISRQLTEMQGGAVGVESEAGKGSTFAFYIKARRANASLVSMKTDSKQPVLANIMAVNGRPLLKKLNEERSLEAYQILIVEDNLVNQKVLTRQLKIQGCKVEVANHGQEALDCLENTGFWKNRQRSKGYCTAVLMDLEMPVMDGLTCVREIRRLQSIGAIEGHIPVIAVTANVRSEQLQTALDAGMDGVVTKPFRIPDLIAQLERLVAS